MQAEDHSDSVSPVLWCLDSYEAKYAWQVVCVKVHDESASKPILNHCWIHHAAAERSFVSFLSATPIWKDVEEMFDVYDTSWMKWQTLAVDFRWDRDA